MQREEGGASSMKKKKKKGHNAMVRHKLTKGGQGFCEREVRGECQARGGRGNSTTFSMRGRERGVLSRLLT